MMGTNNQQIISGSTQNVNMIQGSTAVAALHTSSSGNCNLLGNNQTANAPKKSQIGGKGLNFTKCTSSSNSRHQAFQKNKFLFQLKGIQPELITLKHSEYFQPKRFILTNKKEWQPHFCDSIHLSYASKTKPFSWGSIPYLPVILNNRNGKT